jgi:hypothetical protein
MSKNYTCCFQNTPTFYSWVFLSINGVWHAKKCLLTNIFLISSFPHATRRPPFMQKKCLQIKSRGDLERTLIHFSRKKMGGFDVFSKGRVCINEQTTIIFFPTDMPHSYIFSITVSIATIFNINPQLVLPEQFPLGQKLHFLLHL